MSESTEQREFWLETWKTGRIGFHQPEVEPWLARFFGSQPPGKVFVPLCGKSLDLVWLAGQGHEVLGVELSPLACEAFFRENFPEAKPERRVEGAFTVYTLGAIRILCGDYFSLEARHLEGVTAVYDRAALIALPPDVRRRYVAHLLGVLERNRGSSVEMLLITLDDVGASRLPGPPYSVGAADVSQLFGGTFEVREVAREDVTEYFGGGDRGSGVRIFQLAFRMKRK